MEEIVPFTREISAIIARGISGEVRMYPIAENVHRRHIRTRRARPPALPPVAWQHVHDIG